MEKQLLKNASLDFNKKPYISYKTDLSHVKRNKSWQEYAKKDNSKLYFLIRDNFIYLRKTINDKMVRQEKREFKGFIPMDFSMKCLTYCSDCGICNW